MRVLAVGKGLTLLVGVAVLLLYRAPRMAWTAVAFGLLATTLQWAASKVHAQVAKDAPFAEFVKGWGAGMGLRLLGVVVLAVVCTVWPNHVPALAAAIGYLGVLIPLLFLETRTA